MPPTFGTEGFSLRGKDINYCSPCDMSPCMKNSLHIFKQYSFGYCSCLTNWEVKYVPLFAVSWSLKYYLLSDVWSLFVLSSACSSVSSIKTQSEFCFLAGIMASLLSMQRIGSMGKSGNLINSRISALGINKQDYSKKVSSGEYLHQSVVPTMHYQESLPR